MKIRVNKGISEGDLIRGCIRQDRVCQRELYDRYSSKMFGVCLRYTGDRSAAEDLLQEGFIKVYQKVGMFRFEGSFEGWVRRIFINLAIEHHRRAVHLYPIIEVQRSGEDFMEEEAISAMSAAEIMELVHSLSPGYRTVFNLYVVDGLGHKEIAGQLGITEGTSKSQLARARVILQRMINERVMIEKEAYV